jgi:Tol biopolymer transport system component
LTKEDFNLSKQNILNRFMVVFLLVVLCLPLSARKPAEQLAAANPQVKGAFFGQALPGETPVLFAPEKLNALSAWVAHTDFSPDGTQFFASVGAADYSSAKLYYSKFVNDVWTPFAEAPFIADFTFSNEPVFSADGAILTFTGKKAIGSLDLWTVNYANQLWGTPVALPAPINSDAKEGRGSTLADGTLYFSSARSGMFQVYKGYKDATKALAVERVGPPISTNSYEGDPCIAPDGRFLIFYSARDWKSSDLYVSFSDGNGGWGTACKLGDGFNTPGDEYGAHLSADGKILFFTRHTAQGNGIYWVAVSAIDKLNPGLVTAAHSAEAGPPDKAGKVQIKQLSDLPTHSYIIQGKPSAAVQDREAMLALSLQLERDLKADLGKYDIQDKNVRQRYYVGLYAIAMLKKDHPEARRYLDLVRGLQENPTARLLAGVITGPYMDAMEKPGADFHATFRALLSEHFAALPYEEVQGTLRAMKDNMVSASKAQMVGSIEAGLDPLVKDGQLGQEMAVGILSTAMNLEFILPVKDDVAASLEALFEANKTAAADSAVKAQQAALGVVKTLIRGAYFGQPAPGEAPVPFAPEILNEMGVWVETIAFSPDGTECFLDLGNADYSSVKIYHSTRVNDVWTPFVAPSFLAEFVLSAEAVFSSDGRALTFTGLKPNGSKNLWTTRRTDQGWSAPVALPPEINNGDRMARGSVMSDGTLYFGKSPAGLHNQIYKAHKDASQKLVVELLGAPVNAQSFEGDPCIAPDGRFLVFYSGRIGGQGGTDLYVSFPDGRGGWMTPLNLETGFNSPYDEYGAHLSADGKVLFFTRHTSQGNSIYWVATSAIDKLKK